MEPSVLIIQPSIFVNGGAERQIAELANYLTDRNYRVCIASTMFVEDFKKSIKEARLLQTANLNNLYNFVQSEGEKFEVINPHNHPSELFAHRIKRASIWQCNEPPDYVLRGGKLNEKEKDLVRNAIKKTMVISDYDFERYKNLYGTEPIVNYPGVRHSIFSNHDDSIAEEVNQKYSIRTSKDDIILLQTGYLTWTKNQIKTVEILHKVKKEYPNAKLVLAGYDKDPYADDVRKKINQLELYDSVIMIPYIESDAEFKALYEICNVFVNPVLSQGGYATTFEAICAGIPTVVSDKFIASELIKKHKLGVVSTLDDFAENVIKAIDGSDKIDYSVARQWIGNNLTWNNFGKKYEDAIKELI